MFWVDSIAHRAPAGKCLLIGTHCEQRSEEEGEQIVMEQFELLKKRFPNQCWGYGLVDSVEDVGVDSLVEKLCLLAKNQVFHFFLLSFLLSNETHL